MIWYHLYNLRNVKNTHGGCYFLQSCRLQHCSMGIFHVFKFVQMVPNRAKHHIFTVNGKHLRTVSVMSTQCKKTYFVKRLLMVESVEIKQLISCVISKDHVMRRTSFTNSFSVRRTLFLSKITTTKLSSYYFWDHLSNYKTLKRQWSQK